MSLFRRKASEDELERAILRAASIAKAKEMETANLASNREIGQYLKLAFDELKIKADKNQKKIAQMSIQALLTEKHCSRRPSGLDSVRASRGYFRETIVLLNTWLWWRLIHNLASL